MIFVVSGINNSNFEKNNPYIALFIKEQITAFENKYPLRIAVGTSLIIIGFIVTIGIDGLKKKISITEALENSMLFFFASIGVSVLVYNGMQKTNMTLKKIQPQTEKNIKGIICGTKIHGVIMLLAVIIFLVTGIVWHIWQYNWLAFVIGGILCGIVPHHQR